MKKTALVCGAGGFIGGHLVNRLLKEGYKVVSVDIKYPSNWFQTRNMDWYAACDLRDKSEVDGLFKRTKFDEVFQLAAKMGGAGFIFTGKNDADVMHDSALINLNILEAIKTYCPEAKVFYSSSACVYPEFNQMDPQNPICSEDSAYPAQPDSEYGWEKLFSERLYMAYHRNYGIDVRIARFHNIYGPNGTYDGGKEKAPAAMLRKAIEYRTHRKEFEIWGTGEQTRSFLYIDDCIDAVRLLMERSVSLTDVVNIGSEEMVTINELARLACKATFPIGTDIPEFKHIDGPLGVNGRVSDNTLIKKYLDWEPKVSLREGMERTGQWIYRQMVPEPTPI